ncbi:MAG: hypothetical protein K2M54_08670 [Muribaculaceae bacterium]|nr:hypothetical protein [Muribaculaceae bacterium]
MKNTVLTLLLMLLIASCGDKTSFFRAEISTKSEPKEIIELDAEKVGTDNVFSQFFAVYDTLLISCRPNSNDCFFDVVNINNDELIGSFLHRGQGPSEYLGLYPILRIERKDDDLVALTLEPNKQQIIEWNITKSIELERDSVICLGTYQLPKDCSEVYQGFYAIGNGEYLGQHTGNTESYDGLPNYWILEGDEAVPSRSITVFKDMKFEKPEGMGVWVPMDYYYSSAWTVSPDNSKIFDAMNLFNQINIIDLQTNELSSYRVKESPSEGDLKYGVEDFEKNYSQYTDVVCNDSVIYALYYGEPSITFKDTMGCFWLHEFDWSGNFKKKYRLPISIMRLWLDPSSDTLYGYCEPEDAVYKLNVE